MKRVQWWVLFVTVGVFFLLVHAPRPGAQTAQAPVTLKAVTAWTKGWPFNDMYFEWIKRVNEAGVKIIELPAAEVGKVNRVQWEEGSKAFLLGPSPKYGVQLRELMSRFAPR